MINFKLRRMVVADLHGVVVVHQKAFKGFFLEKMGTHFLLCYYRAVLSYGNSITYIALGESGEVLGFATGFRNPNQFYAYFRKQRRSLLPAILIAVAKNPRLIRDIFRNSRRVSKAIDSDPMSVELSSIATSAHSKGIGTALLNAFCGEAFGLGAKTIELTTDEKENNRVRQFYEKAGFELVGTRQSGGRMLSIYQLINKGSKSIK